MRYTGYRNLSPLQKDDRKGAGSALIETSLMLLLFVVMLIGIYDFGQFLFLHQTLTERARAAVRWGVVNTYDSAKIQNVVLYGQATEGTHAIYGLTREMVSVTRSGAGTSDDRVVVTISNYPVTFISPLIAGVVQGQPVTAAMSFEEM